LGAAFTWRLAAERDRALEAEREATVQAATAARVSDFLVSVFNVSNPRLRSNRNLSARDVLDEGATRIEHELADSPRVKARLLDVLGSAYRSIGEPVRAIDLFRQAVDLYRSPPVDDPLAAAATLSQLAVVYSNNKFAGSEAEATARESLRLREGRVAPDSLEMADALNTLGVVLEANGQAEAAEPLLQRALAIRTPKLGADSLQVASTLHNLALVADERGDDARAAELFGRALAIKRAKVGEHHPDYQNSLDNYASALGRVGRREEALAILRENVGLARELYGDANEHLATAHNELGSQLHDIGRFTEAADEYRAALAVHARIAGDGVANASRAMPLNNLASALEDMGEPAAALPLFRESLDLRRSTQDAGSPMILRAENNLARVLTRAGDAAAALPLIDSVVAAWRQRDGEANLNTAKAEAIRIEALLALGRVDEARATRARMGLPGKAANASWTTLLALSDARIARRETDPAAALASADAAWQAVRAQWGERHPLIVEAGLLRAEALRRNGRGMEAGDLVAFLRPIAEASLAPVSPLRAALAAWR
ncbi:MAG: tetratricopeptide repeat protein, partial [Xanthomonadales bacterium]|nr:tetratricopeptide repeat protein [Xanthomonadales bacterium]